MTNTNENTYNTSNTIAPKQEVLDDVITVIGESTKPSEFESVNSLLRYKIDVTDDLAVKYADLMSKNDKLDSVKSGSNKILKKTTQYHL